MIDGILHPGLILICVGFLAMLVPKALRKVFLACGPLFALYAVWQLPVGTDISLSFVNDYKLGVIFVDKLS